MITYSYNDAISIGFPGTVFSSVDIEDRYENINWISGPSLSKEELDTWIVERVKLDMWELIKAERDRRTQTGGYKVGSYWFHSDQVSRIQQLALVLLGPNVPAGLLWKTLSGTFVPMSPTLAQQIFGTAVVSDTIIFGAAEQKRAAMEASEDPANYDYLSNWPLIYGE